MAPDHFWAPTLVIFAPDHFWAPALVGGASVVRPRSWFPRWLPSLLLHTLAMTCAPLLCLILLPITVTPHGRLSPSQGISCNVLVGSFAFLPLRCSLTWFCSIFSLDEFAVGLGAGLCEGMRVVVWLLWVCPESVVFCVLVLVFIFGPTLA